MSYKDNLNCEGLAWKWKWCPEAESNHRHEDFQSSALPTELSGHYKCCFTSVLVCFRKEGRIKPVFLFAQKNVVI